MAFSFGSTSTFGAPAPASAPAFSFGGAAPAPAPAPAAASAFSFGGAAPAPAPAAAAAAAPSFSFGGGATPAPAPAAPAAPGGLFGSIGAPAPAPAAPAPASAGSTFSGGFFGAPSQAPTTANPNNSSSANPPPPSALTFSLSSPAPVTSAAPAAPAAAASTIAAAPASSPSSLSSAASAALQKAPVEKPLEDSETLVEIMKRWKSEVEIQKEEFVKQSKQVTDWDASLRSARVGLTRLSDDVSRLNKEQEDIESSLTHVGNHNTRLKNMLEEIERYLDFRLGAGQNGEAPESASQATAQAARAEAYDAARRIESLLSVLGDELQSVNDLISKGLSNQIENPLDKAKIVLAAEVNSLGDIERASNEVYERAKKLRAQAQMYKR